MISMLVPDLPCEPIVSCKYACGFHVSGHFVNSELSSDLSKWALVKTEKKYRPLQR